MGIVKRLVTKILKLIHGALGKCIGKLNSPILNQVISLQPKETPRGDMLLSYRIELFLKKQSQPKLFYPVNCQKSFIMAKVFNDLGFAVDVIANKENRNFLPQKKYSFFIDTRMNLERLAPLLGIDCWKILYVTAAHPYFNNAAEANRLINLQERKHVTLRSRRCMDPTYAMAVEYADGIIVPSKFSMQNFHYAKKPFYLVPNCAEFMYPWPEEKNFEACRTRFMWLGSSGMVHKGLDLLLEAFSGMPEFHLTICGPVANEKDFEQVYRRELYHTPNICTFGWIDINSPDFYNLASQCVGFVYPSCSEGSAGAVITCLHAGLIPIISYEAGVDVDNNIGIILHTCSIQEIQEAVRRIANVSSLELQNKSRKAWEFARKYHTLENFEKQFKITVEKLMVDFPMKATNSIK